MVGCKPVLSVEDAEALYAEYAQWLEARERFSPPVLARKYGISVRSVRHYGKRQHKRRAA